ncbi:MAG: NmrA family NAD(P)-binding protein [Pseudomonadota bacterium]
MTFVVAGISGNTGSVVAETLLARGENVRVVVREASAAAPWAARGTDVAIADLEDASALGRALRGARGAYLLIPPSFTAPSLRVHQTNVARSLAAAALESAVGHVVLLSGFAAHRDNGSGPLAGLHDAERLLGAVPGLRLSSIRAGYFYENVFPVLSVVKDAGVLPSFFPAQLPVPMVATRDIGLLAADLLLDPMSRGVVELGSGLTYAEIARVLGGMLGKPVRVDEIAPDAILPLIASLGFNADLTNAYVELITGIRSGALAFEGGHRHVRASTPLDAVFRAPIAE